MNKTGYPRLLRKSLENDEVIYGNEVGYWSRRVRTTEPIRHFHWLMNIEESILLKLRQVFPHRISFRTHLTVNTAVRFECDSYTTVNKNQDWFLSRKSKFFKKWYKAYHLKEIMPTPPILRRLASKITDVYRPLRMVAHFGVCTA